MGTNENPFAPPSQEAELGQDESFGDGELKLATQGTRFVNMLVDSVCHYVLIIPAALMAGFLGQTAGPIILLVAYILLFLYYPLFEHFFGKTPGKWLTKTHVVRVDGGRPRLGQIIGRSFARYVPFEPFSFFGSSPGWHDAWSGTRVVRDTR